MTTSLLALSVVLFLASDSESKTESPRKPHPFAPSLPELTAEEEKKLDEIIDRFILYDTGRLRGREGILAARAFAKLGPEAIPALIRGLNRAAAIDHSCPASVIGEKLGRMLAASRDVKLLQFARDEIGAGVGPTRHAAVLQNIRVSCMLRKNALIRAGAVGPNKAPRFMTTEELADGVSAERGRRQKLLLFELARRPGDDAIKGLARGAVSYEEDVREFACKLLVRNLSRQKPEVVRDSLKHDRVEVRLAAIRAVAARRLRPIAELIDRLEDDDQAVRDLAHQTLVDLTPVDFGPSMGASAADRKSAIDQWRAWLEKRGR